MNSNYDHLIFHHGDKVAQKWIFDYI